MRGRSRRRRTDRKIVELLMGGGSVKRIARSLHVSKSRVRRLRERSKECGYLNEEGDRGNALLPPYPEAIFPDPVDRRSLRLSEHHLLLESHREWIQERLEAGWHAVTVFEELTAGSEESTPSVSAVTRSSFYRYLERHRLNRVGELARLEFVRDCRIALFVGAAGLGKIHLALALGVLAAKQGYRVFCASTKKLMQTIQLAKLRGSLDLLFKRMLSCQLWIIDDWGVVSMSREIAEEVFDLFDRRKYSSAMVLTSNRDVEEWGEVFPDPVLANATIDRIFDRAIIVIFQGQSCRLKGNISLPSSARRLKDKGPDR